LDKSKAVNLAKIFAVEVKNKYDINRMFLFGSYTKGSYHDESDIDIAVIFKDFDNLMDMQLELMRIRRKIDSRIEPHPFREKDFTNSNPLFHEILKYGEEIKE
jgi:predicted nucleotidyltransferase